MEREAVGMCGGQDFEPRDWSESSTCTDLSCHQRSGLHFFSNAMYIFWSAPSWRGPCNPHPKVVLRSSSSTVPARSQAKLSFSRLGHPARRPIYFRGAIHFQGITHIILNCVSWLPDGIGFLGIGIRFLVIGIRVAPVLLSCVC